MFDFIPEVCRQINGEMVTIYWMAIVPFTLLVILLEFFKMPESNPDVGMVLKRVVVSIILLMTFDSCVDLISSIGDGITARIGGFKSLNQLKEYVAESYKGTQEGWMLFKKAVIFIVGLISFIVAYLGILVAKVLISFVWAVLYICAPLMILMYIHRGTAFVTASLYRGLINVMVWKILWSLLGVLLLRMASSPEIADSGNFVVMSVMNLCIGASMLFIPLTTKSLISDGLVSAATGMAMAPTLATSTAIKQVARRRGGNALRRGGGAMMSVPRKFFVRKPVKKSGAKSAKEKS